MSGVTDVTPGWKYLLQNDDLAMVQVTQAADGTVTTSLVTMNTSNSGLSGTPQTVTIGSSSIQRRQPVSSLTKAVSRASEWVRRMEIGECKHQRALAKTTGLEPRYINSILRVAFLAPEIVEAIIDGQQPPDLTLGSLTGVLPMSWQQQKKLTSFS